MNRRLLPIALTGPIGGLLVTISLMLHFAAFLPFAILKVLLPHPVWHRWMTAILTVISDSWLDSVTWLVKVTIGLRYVESGETQFPPGHYLILPNHRAWWDIVLLFRFCRLHRLPFPRFFLKRELIWVPMIGLVCWALDMPFMRRYDAKQIVKNPELRGRDLSETRRACAKYRNIPITVVNFMEGTRYNPRKQAQQESPFAHLLKPRASGTGFVLNAMGKQFDGIIDLSIVYPGAVEPSVVNIALGRIPEVRTYARRIDIPVQFTEGDLRDDYGQRRAFHEWINQMWLDKDARITELKRH